MTWEQALKREVLGRGAAVEIERFALANVPLFRASTDTTAWRRKVRRLRQRALDQIYLRGFPAGCWHEKPAVVWGETLSPHASYRIRKLRYRITPEYWIPALLYEPVSLRGKVPVVLNPNGHHSGGKAAVYKQARCANLARRGVMALNFEFIGMGELEADVPHSDVLAQLNLTGMAGYGFMVLAMKKGLDILLAHRHADPSRVGMTGLSGGGWQTIVLSALDPRITLSVPVAGYTSIRTRIRYYPDRGDIEQIPPDLTTVLDYQDMTAMLAPRPALLILNERDDCCFQTDRTRPVIYGAVKPVYRAFRALDRFETYNNVDPGTHNYEADNRGQLYRFLRTHFGLPGPDEDIHAEEEILAEEELRVGLPEEHRGLRPIAVARARRLAAEHSMPRSAAEKRALRKRVARIVKWPRFEARTRSRRRTGRYEVRALKVGPFTVPTVSVTAAEPKTVELMVTDWGRRSNLAQRAVPRTVTRVVCDIFGTGENAYNPSTQMVVESAGFRVLGIQAAQILACAEAVLVQTGDKALALVADGPVTSLAALVAAGQRPRLFETLTVYDNLSSLALAIERNLSYGTFLPLFCFGLLEVADVPQLVALLDGIPYRQAGRQVKDA